MLSSLKLGESVVLHDVWLMRRNTKVRIYATRRTGRNGEESLIILASPLECDYTEALYRKRWTLETAFRALKSAGFNMEETHLGVKRFENMLTLLMIAFAAVFIDGLVKIESLPIPMMKSRNVQRISIFRYGYVNLLHDFWANVKNLYVDVKKRKLISLLTNDMESDPEEIIAIYRQRWEIELLFKQMKQNFPLKYFYGESANAIKIQIWITLIANLLLMVMQKGLKRQWSFSGLATMVRITLMYYVDFNSLFNNPEKEWEIILSEASPERLPNRHCLTEGACKVKRRLEHRKISVRAILYCAI